jgi:hypothetical protein
MKSASEENQIKISLFLKKAEEAFASRKWVALTSNLNNALNIDPENKDIQEFINGLKESVTRGILSKEEFERLNNLLRGVLKVNTLMRDKSIVKENTFNKKRDKKGDLGAGGVTSGYEGIESSSGDTFMIKNFAKKPSKLYSKAKSNSDRKDAVTELVASDLYKILLYDKTPRIAVVESENPDMIQIRSKYLTDAMSLIEFVRTKEDLQKITGVEKIFAACAIMGERDHHTGNLMVRPSIDEKARRQGFMEMTKIDHGRSLSRYPSSFREFCENILTTDQGDFYLKRVQNKEMRFNLHEYTDNLNNMLSRVNDSMIDDMVGKRIDELKKLGFTPSHGNIDMMKSEMIQDLKNHFNRMRKYAKILLEISNQAQSYPNSIEREYFENYDWVNRLNFVMKNSNTLTPRLMVKLMNFVNPKPWDKKTTDTFFEVIRPNSYGLFFQKIQDFLNYNPYKNLGQLRNSDGVSIFEHMMQDPDSLKSIEDFKNAIMLIFGNSDDITGVNVQNLESGETALMQLADKLEHKHSIPLAKFLIQRGANVNIQDDEGNTVLMRILMRIDSYETLSRSDQLFMDLLSKETCSIALQNDEGRTVTDILEEKISSTTDQPLKKMLTGILANVQRSSSIEEKSDEEFIVSKSIQQRKERINSLKAREACILGIISRAALGLMIESEEPIIEGSVKLFHASQILAEKEFGRYSSELKFIQKFFTDIDQEEELNKIFHHVHQDIIKDYIPIKKEVEKIDQAVAKIYEKAEKYQQYLIKIRKMGWMRPLLGFLESYFQRQYKLETEQADKLFNEARLLEKQITGLESSGYGAVDVNILIQAKEKLEKNLKTLYKKEPEKKTGKIPRPKI